ncbi:hypothetical protein [Klebsiella pneumoniae IS43]|uniref:Uncharacterized protein n=1 Tax=Klebsiella pneumoniae IS43 TaxID=1432552 RepID=W1DUQ5_KLEPN|nr:hypothetical protein [Klebsiella pneumoniae IS43]
MPALTLNAPTINENGKSPMHRGIIALAPRKMTFFIHLLYLLIYK